MAPTERGDAGHAELRYSARTQDAAYRAGAYDYIDEIGMTARMAVIASMLRQLGVRRVLDLGCGPAPLLRELPTTIAYLGIDIAPTALEQARQRFAARPDSVFWQGDFREMTPDSRPCDALVWAGIGRTWTRQGKGGDRSDWLEVLALAEPWLSPDALVVLEVVSAHWPVLEELLGERYDSVVGCDIDHLDYDGLGRRAIRVYRRRPDAAP